MTSVPDNYYISTDPHQLDVPWVVFRIRSSYWGGWRTEDLIRRSLTNSLCFGLYRDDPGLPGNGPALRHSQVGFARAVTDYATFAWLADVIIDPSCRGKGLGKFLVDTAVGNPQIAKTVIWLATEPAREEWYARFGFSSVNGMRKIPGKP